MQADRACERRMTELAERAAKTGVAQRTGFLSPAEMAQAEISARLAGVSLFSFGGIDGAERRAVAFADGDWFPEWSVRCVRIDWNARYGALGHRDLLGALLALGIEREKIGDIYAQEGCAHVFALADMAHYIEANLEQAGSVPVKAKLMPLDELPALGPAEGTQVRGTVASMRLDAVLGVAWNLSRGRAAELVASGRVQVDHQTELRPDRQLSEGKTLSVRGLGRAKIEQIGSLTKKGRIGVTLTRF